MRPAHRESPAGARRCVTAADVEQDLRERIATACRVLARLNLTREPAGHVSARIPGTDRILIKARGPDESGVRFTSPDDIIEVDMNGKKVSGREGHHVPQEVFIHTWMYKTRPDIESVIHVHPSNVVMFTVVDVPLLPIYGAYDPASLMLYLKGIPEYGRSILISNDELGEDLSKAMGDKDVCMMRGHGITAVGASIEAAGMNTILINELAEMNYKARLIGTPRPIPDEDIEVFKARLSTGRSAGPAAWKTYRMMVDD